ncbi:MAG TPA: hypothetical protein VIH52_00740 [Candidatus Nanoarchaeia archaeon]
MTEKSLFNQVGEVKGKSAEGEESFSFQFTPQNENLKRTRGSLFTLVIVEGKGEDRYEKAKAYYHAFQGSYYAKAAGSIISSLGETLDQLEAAKKEDEGLKYSLVAAVLWGAVLYLARDGKNGVWVSRGEKLKKLDFNKVASGVLEDGDTVVIASGKFDEAVSEEELGKWLGQEKFEVVLEEIDKKIASVEGAACVAIRLTVHNPEEEAKPLAIGEADEKGKVDFPVESEEEPPSQASEEEKEEGVEVQEEEVAQKEEKSLPKVNIQEKVRSLLTKTKPLLRALGEVARKIFAKVSAPWRARVPGELVDHVAVRRARLAQVVILVVLILFVSLSFGALSRGGAANKEKLASILTSVNTQLEEARNIKTIDPNRAKSLVAQAQKDLEEAKKLDSKNKEVKELETEAAELVAEITRSYRIDKLETVFDFSKLESGAKVSGLALNSGQILATDEEKNLVYSLDLESLSGSKVGSTFNHPSSIISYPDGFYIQDQDGVTRYEKIGGKLTKIAENTNWKEIVGAATFQANLYLLDKGAREIWRYLSTSSGLSAAKAYISGEKPDLSKATGIAIDDFVWVLTSDGQVYKFAQGKKQEFTLSNISDSFGEAVVLFTNPDTKNLYILDQGKGRLLVIGKDGVYQAAYSHDDLHKATSVVVDETGKKAYVSVGGKILSLKTR